MTGVADFYLCLKRPYSSDARKRLMALFKRNRFPRKVRFVVLSWKRTGSNLLCGLLHDHPEITMHNELFNSIDIYTHFTDAKNRSSNGELWTVLTRDLCPEAFLDHFWSGKYVDGTSIRENATAIGFKSFPEHWIGPKSGAFWKRHILKDHTVKKIILHREDELAVYVSMMRAENPGNYMYMTQEYPEDLKFTIDPAAFQCFIVKYRDTFEREYRSPTKDRDTFRISYEQLQDVEQFDERIRPLLFCFLGVDDSRRLKPWRETTKQANPDEGLRKVIQNYAHLEFCFRHTDVTHFMKQNRIIRSLPANTMPNASEDKRKPHTWSILLPICSRIRHGDNNEENSGQIDEILHVNRFTALSKASQHSVQNRDTPAGCWKRLRTLAKSLEVTSTPEHLERTECVVGIDVDDEVFNTPESKGKINDILPTRSVTFVYILPDMYGKVCHIWNRLGWDAKNDFLVFLGDDIELLDKGWQRRIEERFRQISMKTKLPFGAACVAMNDVTFPGFPTFPVIHRWHLELFGRILPLQFVNQGGDPYLYEMYSRFNTSIFETSCRLKNTIGGDDNARYPKYSINWQGQVLSMSLMKLNRHLGSKKQKGICLDVIVPSYRTDNEYILKKVIGLRASIDIYVKLWIIIDNVDRTHIESVKSIAKCMNEEHQHSDGNYFVNVIHYGKNRGVSFARNMGYNLSTADWVIFLDDDVVPEATLLDAYAGAIYRFPEGKVFVGLTEIPKAMNLWTEVLSASNVMFFYGVSKRRRFPPWGVTANLMVRGARFNHTIQFKNIYPKTGGGEDMDFIFQMKEWYKGRRSVVSVPGAIVKHPWWNNGKVCYKQIRGWAWGESMCLSEWPEKTYLTLPNWIESMVLLLLMGVWCGNMFGALKGALAICVIDHMLKACTYFPAARKGRSGLFSWVRSCVIAFGAGTVMSSQEMTRLCAVVRRCSPFTLCRRMDWWDGEAGVQVLDAYVISLMKFAVFGVTGLYFVRGDLI